MSRMTTSCANLSWAMPAMQRACSSGVRAGMLAAVEAVSLDQLRNGRGHEALDRPAARNAVTDVARSDRKRLDLEEQDVLRTLELGKDFVEALARIARPRRNREPRAFEDRVRLLPVEEVRELVGADQNERIVPPARAQHVDRALIGIELDLVLGKRGARESQARVGVDRNVLVNRTRRDEDDELLERKLLVRGARELDVTLVRRIEGAAEQPCHAFAKSVRRASYDGVSRSHLANGLTSGTSALAASIARSVSYTVVRNSTPGPSSAHHATGRTVGAPTLPGLTTLTPATERSNWR